MSSRAACSIEPNRIVNIEPNRMPTYTNIENDMDDGASFWRRILVKFFRAASIYGIIIALSLSITAIILVTQDKMTLKQNEEEIDSLRKRNDKFHGNASKISDELSRKLEEVKSSLTQLITDVKVSLQKTIDGVEIALDTRLIVVQDKVSDLHTNVNKLQTNFGSFQDETDDRFSEVWKQIQEINRKIGRRKNQASFINYIQNFATLCSVVIFTIVFVM